MKLNRRIMLLACVALTPLLLVAAIVIAAGSGAANASSHREAPAISKDPFADNTDTYVWIPDGVTDRISLMASYIPFEGPEGGPNYWEWDPNVLYRIFVDNDGDATADITYTLSSRVDVRNPFGTFLYNTGPIDSLDDPDWNRPQYITVTEYFEPGTQPGTDGNALSAPADHAMDIVANQLTAPVNIGSKSTPNYGALAQEAIRTYNDPRTGDEVVVYAGQTDDPFWVDLQVFDLLTLRGQEPPVGYETGNNDPVDSLSGYNVHSFVVEVPISRLVEGEETVLGVWATAERQGFPTLPGSETEPVQVSRLGMPLVNEVVIPMGAKDIFNTLKPNQDLGVYTSDQAPFQGLLQEAVEDPEIGNLLCALYGVPLPDSGGDCETDYQAGTPRTGRGDIFDIFLQGMVLANPFTITTAGGAVELPAGFNVNRFGGEAAQPNAITATPAEMIRINTAVSGDLCHPDQDTMSHPRLGVLGGNACGFPNGRRPMDDVVEIELLAVAGAAYNVLDGREDFEFNPAFISVLDDNVDMNDVPFMAQFPYAGLAQSGQEHIHENPMTDPTSLSFGNVTLSQGSAPWLQVAALAASVGLIGAFEWLRRRRHN